MSDIFKENRFLRGFGEADLKGQKKVIKIYFSSSFSGRTFKITKLFLIEKITIYVFTKDSINEKIQLIKFIVPKLSKHFKHHNSLNFQVDKLK